MGTLFLCSRELIETWGCGYVFTIQNERIGIPLVAADENMTVASCVNLK